MTGGSQGIGAAVVELAAKAGHEFVFTGRNDQFIDAVAKKTGVHGAKADVSVPEDNARTVDFANRVVPQMKPRKSGDIVNIASTSGMKGAAASPP